MEYRTIKKWHNKISLLGFGCMRFPLLENGQIDEKQTEQMLDLAIKEGINYIDTAYPYLDGKSEPLVGRLLKKYERSSYFLATKLPIYAFETKEEAYKIFHKQLERLQTNYVDFYLLHAMDKSRWEKCKKLGILDMCEELKKEGKIKHFGFSFHDSFQVFEEMINYHPWDFCQIQLNYMDVEEQAGIKGYELAKSLGIPVVVMEPLKGGSLTKFSNDVEEIFKKENPNKSIASWGLRFIGELDNVMVMLSGMSTYEQVVDNLSTFKDFKPLNEKEKVVLNQAIKQIKSRVKNGCTGCRYCMPCPNGVDIPQNFYLWNRQAMYDNYKVCTFGWKNLSLEKRANNCIGCGKCEKLCPQHLSIRQDLKNAYETLKVIDEM